MLKLAFKADMKPLHKALAEIQAKQIPFATALALTQLAAGEQEAEVDEETKTFDKVTPFTKRAFGKVPATKQRLVATLFIKDFQPAGGYSQQDLLTPYVVGGNRFMGNKPAMRVPVDAKTNQYGNLSKGQLARYQANPNVFIGSITFRKSRKTISGVWQRSPTPRGRRKDGSYGTKGARTNKIGGVRTTLTLLIQFEDTTPVKKHLDFYGRARAYVKANAQPVSQRALASAISKSK